MDLEMKMKDGGAMISASRNNPPKDTELDAYDYKQLCERAGMEYKDAIANEFTKYDLARIIRAGKAKGGAINGTIIYKNGTAEAYSTGGRIALTDQLQTKLAKEFYQKFPTVYDGSFLSSGKTVGLNIKKQPSETVQQIREWIEGQGFVFSEIDKEQFMRFLPPIESNEHTILNGEIETLTAALKFLKGDDARQVKERISILRSALALEFEEKYPEIASIDKQYHALVAELEKKNVPCRVKLTDREIVVETGRDAPDSLDNKISSAASKLGIKNLGLCAETSESGIKSTSIAGGPKDYYRGKPFSNKRLFINASLYRESGGNIEFGEGGMLYIGEQKWNVGDNVNLNFKSTWRGKRLYTTPTNRAIINKGDGYEVKNPTRIPSVMFNGRKFKTIAEAREAVLDYYKIDRITGKGKDPDYGNNSGGGSYLQNGGTEPEITEYKGYEIMYSPHFKRWFANEEEFTSLPAAKKYIDDGAQLSASTINAYRHGAFAVGGAMHTDVLAQIKKDLESFRPQGEDGDVYEYGKNGFSSNFRYLGNWVDDEENSAEFEDPNSDEYDPGWREDNDNRIWAPGEYKRFKEMFVAWAKQYNWFDKVKLSVQTSEKDSCEFIIEIAEPKSYPPTSVSGLKTIFEIPTEQAKEVFIITDKLHKEGIAYDVSKDLINHVGTIRIKATDGDVSKTFIVWSDGSANYSHKPSNKMFDQRPADRPDRATTETSDAKDIEVLTDQLEALSAALKYLKGADAKAVETNLLIINSALAALQPKKVIWEGKERLVKSIAKVGKEEKYEIELDNGKTIWTNKATIEHHKAITKNIEELRQELSELNKEYWAYPEGRRHEQMPRNLKVDIEKKEKEIRAEEAKYAVGGEISGVTTVKYEDDGETLLYGTKNNQTRVSVKGLSKEDIKEEYEFEKMMYDKSVKGLPEEKLGAARIQNLLHASLKEKKDALDMVRRIEKNIEVMQKIVLPFYEKHLVEDDPHYIEYLDKDNNFRQTKKEFKSFEEARDWGRKNLENFNIDMIRMIRATGGGISAVRIDEVPYQILDNKKYSVYVNDTLAGVIIENLRETNPKYRYFSMPDGFNNKHFNTIKKAQDYIYSKRKNLFPLGSLKELMGYATGGEVLKHKSIPTLSIELLEQTNNGWKVKETDPKGIGKVKKGKISFYSDADIKSLFTAPPISKRGKCICIKTIKFKDGLNYFEKYTYGYCEEFIAGRLHHVTVSYDDGRFTVMNDGVFEAHFKKIVTLNGDDTPYIVIADKGDKYIVVIEEKLDLWNNATPLERAEYYEEWIPKSEFNEA